MTKQEANAALCRALGVEPKISNGTCKCGHNHQCLPAGWVCGSRKGDGRCECRKYEPLVNYPDLTSSDVLMAALHAKNVGFGVGFALAVADSWAAVSADGPTVRVGQLPGETHGSMLFRAACAAFWVEVSE